MDKGALRRRRFGNCGNPTAEFTLFGRGAISPMNASRLRILAIVLVAFAGSAAGALADDL